MLKFGVELEFFIEKGNVIIPAYLGTSNLDGNPFLGELRTGVHNSIIDCVFDLKSRIHKEREELKKLGYSMVINSHHDFSMSELKEARSSERYIRVLQSKDCLKEISAYGKKTGKILKRGRVAASLQINISNQETKGFKRVKKSGKVVYDHHVVSVPFDHNTIIINMDKHFSEDIKASNRVAGVYAIKEGVESKRIEYRSLPANVELCKILELNKILNND